MSTTDFGFDDPFAAESNLQHHYQRSVMEVSTDMYNLRYQTEMTQTHVFRIVLTQFYNLPNFGVLSLHIRTTNTLHF